MRASKLIALMTVGVGLGWTLNAVEAKPQKQEVTLAKTQIGDTDPQDKTHSVTRPGGAGKENDRIGWIQPRTPSAQNGPYRDSEERAGISSSARS